MGEVAAVEVAAYMPFWKPNRKKQASVTESTSSPMQKYQAVKGFSLGRLDSVLRKIGWSISISFIVAVFTYLILFAGKPVPELVNMLTTNVVIVGMIVNSTIFLTAFAIRSWGSSNRELVRGYTTLYSRRALDLNVIDWKTGIVIVPAGEEPPSRLDFNDRVRRARRANRESRRRGVQNLPG